MLNYKIKVFDYYGAFRRVVENIDQERKFAIISIRDVPEDEMSHKYIKGKWCKGAVNIYFSDIDKEIPNSDLRLMQPEDAETIKAFINAINQDPEIEELIVHCYAGASRSPAVAAAIEFVFNGMEASRKYFQTFTPNSHVFRLLMKTWGYDNDGQVFFTRPPSEKIEF